MFEEGSFVPTARITDRGSQSIVTDYLGTPVEAYNEDGNKVWEREIDIYGRIRKENLTNFVPFLCQGQYVDVETGLAYNRFRYYDPSIGSYISQDPIGLSGWNPTLYGYVHDTNSWVDILGLKPKEIPLPSTIDLKPGTKHVLERHIGNNPDWDHKSKWSGNRADWKTTTRDTFRNPDRVIQSGDRFIYEKTYKRPIGVDSDGITPLYKSRVVVEADGKLSNSISSR